MCTGIRFTDSNGSMYFGRNLDWTQGYGERVVVTPPAAQVPAAFERSGDLDAKHAHAVIGMGIIAEGVPLYFDCGNDAGLAVAGLNFPQSARYAADPASVVAGDSEQEAGPSTLSKRRVGAVGADRGSNPINVAAYEFPFWVARNFATLDDAREALGRVTVVAKPVSPQLPVANLHWMIGDATGRVVVECLEGGLHVWENDVDVLTNEPDFGWHRQNLRNYLMLSGAEPEAAMWDRARLAPFGSGMGLQGMPGDYSGPARFVKAAFVNSHYPVQDTEGANVTRLFRTLASVAVPMGAAQMPDGSFEITLYTSCFAAASLTYYHATYSDPQIRAYRLATYDLGGTEPFVAQAA